MSGLSVIKGKIEIMWTKAFIPILIGLTGFIATVGIKPLNPNEIQWLANHDFLQSFLGWEFFRQSEWTIPFGANPKLGAEISSSIVYSDSIPFLAVIFKLFASILPDTFQYFGIWLLICYLLQALLGWKIAALYSKSVVDRSFLSILLVASPIMLWKLDMTHIALVGHFLILYALYLNLQRSFQIAAWGILLVISVLTHFYLFVLVFVLWVSHILDFLSHNPNSRLKVFLQSIFTFLFIFFISYQAGYFLVSTESVSDKSFGNYPMNLLAIFDSRGYSPFLPGIKQREYFDEGFNYLGAGGILLLILSFPAAWISRKNLYQQILLRKYLCFSLFILLLISLTHNFHFGNQNIQLQLSEPLISILSIIRCSGRMFWPIYYLILITATVLILRSYKRYFVIGIFLISLVVQAIDTSPLREKVRNDLLISKQEPLGQRLKNPFWEIAAQNYHTILARPVGNLNDRWNIFGYWAATHQLSTNIVRLARVDTNKLRLSQKNFDDAIYAGNTSPSTIYILEDWKLNPDAKKIHYNKNTDALLRVDGFNVLVPGWKLCNSCAALNLSSLEIKTHKLRPTDSYELFLLDGWSSQEPWGIWSEGKIANAIFPIPDKAAKFLILDVKLLLNKNSKPQEVEVWSNHPVLKKQLLSDPDNNLIYISIHQLLKKQLLSDPNSNLIHIPIPEYARNNGYLWISIKNENPTRVKDLDPTSTDERELSIGLKRVIFQ